MRKVVAVVIGMVAFAGSVHSAFAEVRTRYFLPKTSVTLSATVTTKDGFPDNPADGMVPRATIETTLVSVTLASVPDPKWPMVLTSEAALASKNTVTVELTNTGLLAAVNAKSEGLLGNIIKNVFGAVVSLSKAAAGVRNAALSSAEQKYKHDQPEADARRTNLKASLAKASALVLDLETKLITAGPEERKTLRSRAYDLQDLIAYLRQELSLADFQFNAWKASKEDAKEQKVENTFDADDLPDDHGVRVLAENPDPNITLTALLSAVCTFDGGVKKDCEFGKIVEQTRVIVTRAAMMTEPDTKAGALPGEVSPAIFYREARPVTISVYVLNGGNKPVLSKRSNEFVTGRRSGLMSLMLHNSKWSTKSLGATFTGGILTKVTSESGSEIAGAAEALHGLPAEYLASVKQANEIISEDGKLRLAGVQSQIDDLKKQKELVEARIGAGDAADLATMQSHSARLDAELKVLNSQRALAGGQASSADAALALQVIKLQNDLVEAQVKQLQLQQQLDELRRKAGGE